MQQKKMSVVSLFEVNCSVTAMNVEKVKVLLQDNGN